MPVSRSYRAAARILELGDGFYDEVAPARFPLHRLRFRNQRWAAQVGLGELDAPEWEAHFARFDPLPDNLPTPLALRYHGHQFDVYNPDLGDGRGFLYAQLLESGEGRESARIEPNARLLDLGTKGSGPTPWSRGGDGKLTLKGGLREVLATEMLEALGVSTSKTFSLFETGQALRRGDEPSPTRSSVLVRLGHSHLRFGTFQRLAHTNDVARLETLLAYSIRHYAPSIQDGPRRVFDFLVEVTRRAAVLTASWMVAGFVHGVLNSDNMNTTGESFDYGPYRFLPTYDLDFVAAYFDHGGLYAYGRQPTAVVRNLARLAGSLRALAPHDDLGTALEGFESVLHDETTRRVLARLGLVSRGAPADSELISAVYDFLAESKVGYDQFFFDLYGGLRLETRARARVLALAADGNGGGDGVTPGEPPSARAHYRGEAWTALQGILSGFEPALAVAPRYYDQERPCTLLIDEIETVWTAIAERDDWSLFHEKVEQIREMPRLG